MSESCLQYLYNKKKQIKRERESANFWQFAQLFWFLIVSRHNAIHCALCHIFDSLLKKTYAHFLFGTHYTCQLYSQSSKFYSILSIIDDHFNTLYTIRMLHSFQNLTFDFEKYNFLSLSQWWGLQFGCCFCFILLFSSLILYQLRGYH